MRRAFAGAIAAATVAAACTPPQPPVQGPPREPPSASSLAAGDWPSYNRDLAGTRHSPLRQIDTNNVGDLQRAWSYPLGRNTTTGSLYGGSEVTPVVAGGVMFVAAADRVVALSADTGEERWRYELARRLAVAPRRHVLARRARRGRARVLHGGPAPHRARRGEGAQVLVLRQRRRDRDADRLQRRPNADSRTC